MYVLDRLSRKKNDLFFFPNLKFSLARACTWPGMGHPLSSRGFVATETWSKLLEISPKNEPKNIIHCRDNTVVENSGKGGPWSFS